MTSQSATPETIDKLADGVTYALAMLAGMQLDAWTPLKDGPRTAEQIASSLNVRTFRPGFPRWAEAEIGNYVIVVNILPLMRLFLAS